MTTRRRNLLRIVYGILFVLAGSNHFAMPDFYLNMMPAYLPWHAELVAISGVSEMLLGIGLIMPRTAPVAAWGIVALLIAVFPANINMALHPEQFPDVPAASLWVRLPLQFLLVYWAYVFTRKPKGA